jgi:hypothetical protein
VRSGHAWVRAVGMGGVDRTVACRPVAGCGHFRARAGCPTIRGMQVLATRPVRVTDRLAVLRMGLSALLLVVAGALVGWLCLATPLVSAVQPQGRPTGLEMAAGIFAWAFAIIVPAGFLLLGAARAAATIETWLSLRPRTMSPRLSRSLGADHLAVTDLVMPGGRRIHELILGPFGVAILGEVPPPDLSRHQGGRWELRADRGRWIPIESPTDRAARDAERVRGWLTSDDRDFLVKVYAAVVTDDPRVQRTAQCAVVTTRDLAAWLAGLPPQRGLTPGRRERLVQLLQSIAGGR